MMKCNNKQLLSKLVTATLVGTVGLSAFSVQAATTATGATTASKVANTADSTTGDTQLKYISINSTSLSEGSNYKNDGAKGKDAIAIGVNASTVMDNSIAMGVKSIASKESDIAIGKGAHTEGLSTDKNTANGYNGSSIALGANAWTIRLAGIAIGASAIAGGTNSFAAAGGAKTDGTYAIALGYSATAASDRTTALGYRSKSIGYGSSALGYEAKSNGYESISMGREAEANRISSVAIGRSAKVSSMGGVALGELSVAKIESTQLGYNPLTNFQLTANSAIMGLSDADRATLADLGPKVQKLKDEYIAKETAYNDRITKLNNELAQTTRSLTQGKPKTEEEKTIISEKIKALTSEREKLEKDIRVAKKAYIESADFKAYALLVSTWESTAGAVAVGDRENGITRQITGVAAGTEDTDAVNVAQLKVVADETAKKANLDASNITPDQVNKWQIALGINQNTVGNVDAITLSEGKNVDIKTTYNDEKTQVNYEVSVNDSAIKDAVMPEVDKKLDGKADRDGSNLTNEDVNNWKETLGVNSISNNVSGLQDRVNGLDNRVSKLDNRVDKVGASAAALAALHPLQFDENDKFTVAAGFGNYKGEQAVALGGFYQANEDLLFSLGGTLGDEKMVNAGVSVRFGQKGEDVRVNDPEAVRQLNSEVQALRAKNSNLENTVAEQQNRLAAQDAELQAQRKVIEQLVAKVGL